MTGIDFFDNITRLRQKGDAGSYSTKEIISADESENFVFGRPRLFANRLSVKCRFIVYGLQTGRPSGLLIFKTQYDTHGCVVTENGV